MHQAAFVTGAARRIGRAIALKLAANGYAVAVHYGTSRQAALATCRDIEALGAKAVAVSCDLADTAALAATLSDAAGAIGPLTCLVNNASTFAQDDFATMTPEAWNRQIAVNTTAPVFLAQAFAAQLPDARDGAIVNMIDQRVNKLTPQYFSYTIAKVALWTATRTMAQALAPRIRVNAVAPGPTLANARQDDNAFRHQQAATLLGHGPAVDEIAEAVAFLANARSVTGQMIAPDGGQHLMWQTADTAHDGA